MTENLKKLALPLVLALLLGCGGGSSSSSDAGTVGGSTTFKTSVSGSKMLTALSSSEKTQLCADTAAFITSAIVPAECKVLGVLAALPVSSSTSTDAELRAACTTETNQCLSEAADAGVTVTSSCGSTTGTCTATVAEYSACLSDYPQAFGSSTPACSSLTAASLSNLDGGVSLPTGAVPSTPACNTLVAKCPEAATSTTALMSRAR